jgi:hypothetical protein
MKEIWKSRPSRSILILDGAHAAGVLLALTVYIAVGRRLVWSWQRTIRTSHGMERQKNVVGVAEDTSMANGLASFVDVEAKALVRVSAVPINITRVPLLPGLTNIRVINATGAPTRQVGGCLIAATRSARLLVAVGTH